MDKHIVITIARSYGSGGRTLGKLLAEELGIPCYDRELLKLASEKSGINEALFGKVDEQVKSSPFFRGKRKIYDGEVRLPDDPKYLSDENLFNIQAQVIRELAEKESCIIIGRAADFVLKDYDHVIKLFFYAPREESIKRVMSQNGGTEKEIIEKIEKFDKLRYDYCKYHTGREWNDAKNYDFCLNTASMSYEKLIQAVKDYIKTRTEE